MTQSIYCLKTIPVPAKSITDGIDDNNWQYFVMLSLLFSSKAATSQFQGAKVSTAKTQNQKNNLQSRQY